MKRQKPQWELIRITKFHQHRVRKKLESDLRCPKPQLMYCLAEHKILKTGNGGRTLRKRGTEELTLKNPCHSLSKH